MTEPLYQIVDEDHISVWIQTESYTKSEVVAKIADLEDILALSDNEKQIIVELSTCVTIQDLNEKITTRRDMLAAILAYWTAQTKEINMTVVDM